VDWAETNEPESARAAVRMGTMVFFMGRLVDWFFEILSEGDGWLGRLAGEGVADVRTRRAGVWGRGSAGGIWQEGSARSAESWMEQWRGASVFLRIFFAGGRGFHGGRGKRFLGRGLHGFHR
jgi:hypothetical protein